MKRLVRTCSVLFVVATVAGPVAGAEQAPSEPSAMERLIRQEDARRNDPRLGLAVEPAPQPTAIERLVRQEVARSKDPRLGLVPVPPETVPAIEVVGAGGFDWLSTLVGAVAGAALLLAVMCGVVLARASRPAHPGS